MSFRDWDDPEITAWEDARDDEAWERQFIGIGAVGGCRPRFGFGGGGCFPFANCSPRFGLGGGACFPFACNPRFIGCFPAGACRPFGGGFGGGFGGCRPRFGFGGGFGGCRPRFGGIGGGFGGCRPR